MSEIIGYIALLIAIFCLAKIYKDKPFFKFMKQNRGILLLSYSVITLLGFGIVQGFGRLFPPFITLLVVFMLLGVFYMFRDRKIS